MKTILTLLMLQTLCMAAQPATEPKITIQYEGGSKTFTRSELLKRAKPITLPHDVSYPGKPVTYKAVPVKPLFNGVKIPEGATLQFKCLDGFSAPLSRDRLLKTNASTATPYIAIEMPNQKWPNLENKKVSAGPFYLVWMNPEKSKIGPEEWPYQLAGFEVKRSIEAEFPGIIPDQNASEEVKKGLQVFVKNCFACHTMNKEGHAQMGPDLNVPMNPTEYLKDGILLKLIRNPQNIRHWPQSRMSAFSESMLSNEDISDLTSYLKHMAARKK